MTDRTRAGQPVSRPARPDACAYCLHEWPLFWTGRRWICAPCYREAMGEEPTDD
jgi:hypothetical protein